MSGALVTQPDAVEYPTRDGRPVAETDLHFLRLTGAAYGLRKFFAARDDVYVGSNLMVFDQPGNPRRHLSPDIFVVFGVRSGSRDLFKIWEEQPPAFVLEITSKSTRREDERTKRKRYAQWGVPEYLLYDPRAEWVKPPLQGFRLEGRRYRRMSECVLPNGKRGLECKTLQLYLWLRDGELRLYEPSGGRDLPTPEEEGTARALAEARLDAVVGSAKSAEERTRQDVSAMLVRHAERRFGAGAATRLGALLQRASLETVTAVGDLVLQAATADELLSRVEARVDP